MALRHQLPLDVPDVKPKLDLKIPPISRSPAVVEFRRGCDIREVAKEISGHVSVKVDAAVGAGKSTVLPKDLAMELKTVVFHVAANRLLVRDLYHYVVKCANDSPEKYPELMLHSSYDQVIPRIGVYYISASAFVGLMIRQGGLSGYGQCVVFLDEAHESDAFTHLIRNLSLSLGAGYLIQASATFSAGGFRQKETAGTLVEKLYPAEEVPESWVLTQAGKPWYYATAVDNMLIYTDSRAQAKSLCDGYGSLGFTTFHLTANMTDDAFDYAMATLRDKRGPVVILVADYSFRSGFTFDVGKILDTVRVSYYDSKPGVLAKRSRQAFRFEVEQSAGRGGRMVGLRTEYYRPNVELDGVLCDLEGVEAEACAYLYRVLGYKPVRELGAAVMAKYDLPEGITLVNALNGSYPMAYYVIGEGGVLRAGVQEVKSSGLLEPVESSVPGRERSSSPAVSVSSYNSVASREDLSLPSASLVEEEVLCDAKKFCDKVEDSREWDDLVIALGKTDTARLEVGGLCEVPTLPPKSQALSAIFPRGLDSAVKFMSSPRAASMVEGLAMEDRIELMALLVERYNVCAIEVMAGGQALLKYSKRVADAVRFDSVKQYFVAALEKVCSYDAEQVSLYDMMCVVETPGLRLEEMKDVEDLIKRRLSQYEEEFERVIVEKRVGSSMRAALQNELDEVASRLSISSAASSSLTSVKFSDASCSSSSSFTSGSGPSVKFALGSDAVASVNSAYATRVMEPSYMSRDVHDAETVKVRRRRPKAVETVVFRPPRWLGIKKCEYTYDAKGNCLGARATHGKVLKALTGEDSIEVGRMKY